MNIVSHTYNPATERVVPKGAIVLDLDLNAHLGAGVLVKELRYDGYYDLANQIEEQTKPPRIPEPGSLGAVVSAVCECQSERRLFLLDNTGSELPEFPWKAGCGHHRWVDLIDPTLVRDGIGGAS